MSSPDAERAVIGCILADGIVGMDACRRRAVTLNSFIEPVTRKIFTAMEQLQELGAVADMFTVKNHLERTGVQVDITEIGDCMESVPAKEYIEHYIQELKERERLRNIELACRTAIAGCQELKGSHEITDALVDRVMGETPKADIVKLGTLREAKLAQWRVAKDSGVVGVPSVFPSLNRYLGGYRYGVNTVMGAYRGQGKSTFLRQEALHMAQAGFPVLLLSLEDPADVAAANIVGNYGSFSVFQNDIGHAGEENLQKAHASWGEIADLPLWISSESMNIMQIMSLATAAVQRHGIRAILIDHIQYIMPHKRFNSRNDEVAFYSQQICAMARRLNVVCITASQLARSAERENRPPRLSDLRDSGSIEQDARAVLLLYWNSELEKHLCAVAKNNYGPSGARIVLQRNGKYQRFTDQGVYDEKGEE